MTDQFKSIQRSVAAPQGYSVGGVYCDIKRLETGLGSAKGKKPDLALIVSDVSANVAGMFTTNQICAAPVKLCLARMARGRARAVVVNSGNANACTGRVGTRDALAMARWAAAKLGVPEEEVLVASTGRIGVPLPMTNVKRGISLAVDALGATQAHAHAATQAIMTSDTVAKQIALEFKLGGRTVRLGGITKGAGMIQPGMSPDALPPASLPQGLHATMLSFLTTDAAVSKGALRIALKEAVAQSFNCITVDGDMSTNDTVLLMANGRARNAIISAADARRGTPDFKRFLRAVCRVCLDLAKMMVRDGEGVHRVVTVRVTHARNREDADAAARAIANSALVKTSWHGGDPNWGRIIHALGYSKARVVEEKVDIGYSKAGSRKILWSLRGGQPTRATFKQLCRAVNPKEFELHVRLNLGKAGAVMYAGDLTEEYVTFNKGDINDPASLGG